MNFLLFITIFILTIIFLLFQDFDLLAPSSLFNFGFLFSSIFLVLNTKNWGNISFSTYFIISFGVLIFSSVSLIFNRKKIRQSFNQKISFTTIQISQLKLFVFLLVQIFLLVIIAKDVISVMKPYGGNGLISSVGLYGQIAKFNQSVTLKTIPYNAFVLTTSLGYFFGFILVNNFLITRKINSLLATNFMISLVSSLILGSRTLFIQIIFSITIMYLIQYRLLKGNIRIKLMAIIKILTLIGTLGATLIIIGILFERSRANDIFSYISLYIGAPIKNLDTFLSYRSFIGDRGWINMFAGHYSNIIGIDVFNTQWQTFLKGTSLNILQVLPFNSVNGVGLGNVYTMFYQLILDFGLIGFVILVILSSLLINYFYINLYKRIIKPKNINFFFYLAPALYCYLAQSILMSFFSNKFIESLNLTLIKTILIWGVMIFLTKQRSISRLK